MSGAAPAFRSAITELKRRLLSIAGAPAETATARAAARAVAGVGMAGPRAGKDYDRVASEIIATVAGGEQLDWRRARDGAWCLWTTSPALSEQPAALAAVIEGVSRSGRKSAYRTLALSWLTSFEHGRAGMPDVAAALRGFVGKIGAPFDRLHARFGLFDIETGPSKVAHAAIAETLTPAALLMQTGLSGLSAGGYARHCMSVCLEELAGGREPDPMARLALVRALVLKPDGKLEYEGLGPLAVRALLAPFGTSMPAKEVRDTYLVLLLSLFGDPRLHPGRWTRMRDEEAVIRRWLTEQSLRQFLEIADRATAVTHPNLKRDWPMRRAFWEAVYEKQLITEAWAIFGVEGARLAKSSFGDSVSFGEFNRRGRKVVDGGHTVILLRIGNGVVADWSFNGKCNVWPDAEATGAPKLYRRTYSSDDVHMPDSVTSDIHGGLFSKRHIGAWTQDVAAKLHHMTGVRVPSEL